MSLRILIADDSATNRMLVSATLARMGHKADVVPNGREAVALFHSKPYDIVFLDLHMPLIDGIETAREIQKKNPHNTPVYALSGFASAAMEKKFAAAGIRRCLSKPLDRAQMEAVIAETRLPAADQGIDLPPEVPHKLLSIYAQELRSRANACHRYMIDRDTRGIRREAHTLRALAQMLKTPDVEIAALAVENFRPAPPRRLLDRLISGNGDGAAASLAVLIENLIAACDAEARRLEAQISHLSAISPASGAGSMD